jgi:hypothetical protein
MLVSSRQPDIAELLLTGAVIVVAVPKGAQEQTPVDAVAPVVVAQVISELYQVAPLPL